MGVKGLNRILCCLTRREVRERHKLRTLVVLDSEISKVGSTAPKSGQSVEVGRGKLKWTGLPKHLGGSHRLSLKSKLDNKAFFFSI